MAVLRTFQPEWIYNLCIIEPCSSAHTEMIRLKFSADELNLASCHNNVGAYSSELSDFFLIVVPGSSFLW